MLVKRRLDQQTVTVHIPLADRLPPGALAHFDATVADVDHRTSVGSTLEDSTKAAYGQRYRRYVEWCAEVGYQAGPEFITSEKITEFVTYCCRVKRYAVNTLYMTGRALEWYAQKAGVTVSTLEARAVLDSYWDELAAAGIVKPRTKSGRGRRRRPRQET
jgi:hypothetical protein